MKTGIEYNLVDSWQGWDEYGPNDLIFYGVKLKGEVFSKEFLDSVKDKEVDLYLCLSKSIFEVSTSESEKPLLEGKLKLVIDMIASE